MEDVNPLVVKIERPLYEQEKLHAEYGYQKPIKHTLADLVDSCKNCSPSKIILGLIPAISWLSKYEWKSDFSGDLIAGFTVAILNIPQGMAYALMGNVPAVCGLYTSFFPVLVYCLLGTSRHNSIGTFAVVCLMTGNVVLKYSDPYYFSDHLNSTVLPEEITGYSPIRVATIVTFLVGIFQIIMFVFRLGILNVLLSQTLVSGFTTAAAVQVFTSQLKDILGLKIKRPSGYFEIINTYVKIFKNISTVNVVTLTISLTTITILLFNNMFIKPRILKRCSFPIPMELFVVVTGTILSKYYNLSSNYDIKIIGHIPNGIPAPALPEFSLISSLFIDSIMIAVVSYTLTLSMGLIFAQKLNYEVDANQELLAVGTGNIFGSFFSCLPSCASISRSLLQETVGGKTQLASITSCLIIFFVLMWLGPAFEYLPKAILAGIIIVAVQRMLLNVKDFFRFLKMSKADAIVWMCTFLSVVIVGIDIGLITGITLSLVCVLISGLKPFACLLGSLPHTDLYLDITRYKGVLEVPGIKVFHYRGGINFATKNTFRSELFKIVGIDPKRQLIIRNKLKKLQNDLNDIKSEEKCEKILKLQNKLITNIKCIILDFSAVSYIDSTGISIMKEIAQQFANIGVLTLLAGCSGPAYEKIKKFEVLENDTKLIKMFPTVHDSVQYATSTINLEKNTKTNSAIIA